MKVLLELRPALDGHSGIPQETRLLFRGLAGMEGVDVVGLIQSSNLIVEAGLPVRDGKPVALADEQRIDRLSRVVVSLQQGPASHRLEHLRKKCAQAVPAALVRCSPRCSARKVSLGIFEPTHFKDFLWRGMFAKSLPDADFELVTAQASASCAGHGRCFMPSASLRRSSGAGSTPGSTPAASMSCWSRRLSRDGPPRARAWSCAITTPSRC